MSAVFWVLAGFAGGVIVVGVAGLVLALIFIGAPSLHLALDDHSEGGPSAADSDRLAHLYPPERGRSAACEPWPDRWARPHAQRHRLERP